MSNTNTSANNSGTVEMNITRRRLLRGTAGAGAAAVGLGAAGPDTPLPDAVGESEAALTVSVGVAVLGMAAAAATSAAITYYITSEGKVNAEKVANSEAKGRAYSTALSIDGLRSDFRNDITNNHIKPDPAETSFAIVARDRALAAAAEAHVSGSNPTDAALDRLDKRYTIAVNNAVKVGWNRPLVGSDTDDTMLRHLVAAASLDTGQITYSGNPPLSAWSKSDEVFDGSNWTAVGQTYNDYVNDDSPNSGKYVVARRDISGSTPYPLGDIEGVDSISVYYLLGETDPAGANRYAEVIGPGIGNGPEFLDVTSRASPGDLTGALEVTEKDRETAVPLNIGLVGQYLKALRESYEALQNELPDQVQNQFIPGIESGKIDPSNYLSGEELLKNYSSSDKVTQYMRSALATGYSPAGELESRVRVSHEDLTIDRTGWLFIRFAVDNPPTIKEGNIIKSSEYDSAVLGYRDDGEFKSVVLGGDHTLKILKIEGGSEINFEDSPIDNVDESGDVNIDQVAAMQEEIAALREQIENQQSGGPVLGGNPLSNIGQGVKRLALLGGAAILGLLGLNAASG